MNAGITLTASVFLFAGAATVSAHHSYAMFDASKTAIVTGKVTEFRWTNPHIALQITVTDAAGKEIAYNLEGSNPSELTRRGWKRTSLNPGDTAMATMHPFRSGAPGGQLVSVKVNGQTFDSSGGRGP
jgi:Family of unknown function (DUF6152)